MLVRTLLKSKNFFANANVTMQLYNYSNISEFFPGATHNLKIFLNLSKSLTNLHINLFMILNKNIYVVPEFLHNFSKFQKSFLKLPFKISLKSTLSFLKFFL